MRTSLRGGKPSARLNCETLEDRVTPALAFALTGVAPGLGTLLSFDTATPATTTSLPITGLSGSETLAGLDFRTANGVLYALGVNATADTATLYTVNTSSGAATAVGAAGSVALTQADGATPVDLPDPTTVGYGFDFNPAVDLARVTAGTLSFRISPTSGLAVDANAGVNGTQADTSITGQSEADGDAYTNNSVGSTSTTLYALNSTNHQLFLLNPSTGATSGALTVTLGGPTLNFSATNGFDIGEGVNAATSNTAVAAGTGLAALTVGTTTGLYRIDLTTGAATALGTIGTGTTAVSGFTLAPAGTINFQSATVSASETGGNAAVVLTRTGGTTGPITVTVNVTGGSATAGSDFTGGPYTVNFAAGQTTATLNIPITNDKALEGTETIALAITNVSAGAVGSQATATVSIADNDLQPFAYVFGAATIVPAVITFDSTGAISHIINAYPGLTGGVRVAVGDLNNDGVNDLVTVPVLGPPLVNVYDGATGNLVSSFLAYPAGLGAASIAVGDVNGDGKAEIVVGTAVNFGAVFVYNGQTDALMSAGLPFGVLLPFGINVTTGDTDGDGKAEIIFGTSSVVPVVGVLNGTSLALQNIFAPFGALPVGINVAAGDTDGDGKAEIFVGLGGLAPLVGTINGLTGGLLNLSIPYPGLTTGVNVATTDVNGDGLVDLLVGPVSGVGPGLSLHGTDLSVLNTLLPFGTFPIGLYVG